MSLLARKLLPTCPSSYLSPRFVSCTLRRSTSSLPPRPKPPPETEIEEKLLKGSGPGGQKINKTTSAVQLKHTPTGIVVKSQATRSLNQNRKIARGLLAERLDAFHNGDRSRACVVGKITKKKRDSADKKSRRKYKILDGGKDDAPASKTASTEGPRVVEVRDYKRPSKAAKPTGDKDD